MSIQYLLIGPREMYMKNIGLCLFYEHGVLCYVLHATMQDFIAVIIFACWIAFLIKATQLRPKSFPYGNQLHPNVGQRA